MTEALRHQYEAMADMLRGEVPSFEYLLKIATALEEQPNDSAHAK